MPKQVSQDFNKFLIKYPQFLSFFNKFIFIWLQYK
jgi:hypothetical protein